jgi:hypothetical protein
MDTSDDAPSGAPEPEQPNCEKCGGGLEQLTRLPRAFDYPTFDIFRCIACGFINWIACKD